MTTQDNLKRFSANSNKKTEILERVLPGTFCDVQAVTPVCVAALTRMHACSSFSTLHRWESTRHQSTRGEPTASAATTGEGRGSQTSSQPDRNEQQDSSTEVEWSDLPGLVTSTLSRYLCRNSGQQEQRIHWDSRTDVEFVRMRLRQQNEGQRDGAEVVEPTAPPPDTAAEEGGVTCPICWSPVQYAVETNCGHVFCGKRMCFVPIHTGRDARGEAN